MIEFSEDENAPRPRVRLKRDRFVWGLALRRIEREGNGLDMIEVKWFNPPPENEAGIVETVLWENDLLPMSDFSDLPRVPELSERADLTLPPRIANETDAEFAVRTQDLREKRAAFLAERDQILQAKVAVMNPRECLSHETFLDDVRRRNRQGLERLVAAGVFDGITENGLPIAPAQRFSIAELGEGATMANVMVALKVFPSLKQARNNGWNKPLELGVQEVTKKRLRIEIVP